MSNNKGFSDTSANRYSLALYELASESSLIENIEKNSSELLNLINVNDEFNKLIKDPTVSQDNLTNIIDKISENFKLEQEALNFKSLIENKIKGKVLGPVSAPIFKIKRKYRIRLLIRGPKSLKLQNSLAAVIYNYKFPSGIKLSVDVDPITFN